MKLKQTSFSFWKLTVWLGEQLKKCDLPAHVLVINCKGFTNFYITFLQPEAPVARGGGRKRPSKGAVNNSTKKKRKDESSEESEPEEEDGEDEEGEGEEDEEENGSDANKSDSSQAKDLPKHFHVS